MSLALSWEKAREVIKDKIGQASYDTWFSMLQVKEKDPETLVIETPDVFFKNWIIDHYQIFLQETINGLALKNIRLEFSVNSHLLKESTQNRLNHFEQKFNETDKFKSNLNPRFTFENFVAGASNRFACAAGMAVAESPAKAYNPLFIYGHVGLGKTHLMQAITHKITSLNPRAKCCYMSSERFTNELIESIRHRSTSEFRKKYRELDVLLIDDIQFIAGKESTQEEFFHTFNNLHNNRKQIIITSDRPPKEIAKLEERLSSRFAWGLVTDIQPPDFETRVAILTKKVESEAIKVPNDVIFFIAEQIKTNIRELEGALIRVVAYSLLEEKSVSLELTRFILKDMVKETAKIISIELVQKVVAECFHLPISELRAKKRNKNIVLPRQVAMYVARSLTVMSLPEIGFAFGGKDHTTVLHSCKKIEKMVLEDNNLKSIINQIITTLKQ